MKAVENSGTAAGVLSLMILNGLKSIDKLKFLYLYSTNRLKIRCFYWLCLRSLCYLWVTVQKYWKTKVSVGRKRMSSFSVLRGIILLCQVRALLKEWDINVNSGQQRGLNILNLCNFWFLCISIYFGKAPQFSVWGYYPPPKSI